MKTFTAPAISELGSVTQLTLGNLTGDGLDAVFPVGTKNKDLRFLS